MTEPISSKFSQSGQASDGPLLEARLASKRFGDVVALSEVDFSVGRGEIHALLGENGAGKSTLMNVLSGALMPTAGQIVLAGEPIRWHGPRDAADRGGIGMVHQHFQLVPVFSVIDNLILAVQRSGLLLHRKEVERKAAQIAADLGWSISMEARTGDLSVGAQQRVEIVKTLLLDPRILFFDEPTSVLTPAEAHELFAVLRSLRDRGASIVFVSHKLGEVKALCDRVTILRRGRVVARSNVAEIDEAELARAMIGADVGIVEEAVSMPPESATVLQVDRLCSDPRGRDDVALRDISFAIREGEILGVAGVDGNGQTELFECLIGLRPVYKRAEPGRKNHPLRLLCARPRAAWTPANLLSAGVSWIPPDRRREGLALERSVERNLLLTTVMRPDSRYGPFLSPARMRRQAEQWMAEFDIRAPSVGTDVDSLSGGNQQKIVVARAVARHPKLLIAASPTRGLDVGATSYVHQKLRDRQRRKTAIVLISPELEEIRMLANRIAVIYEGRIMGIVGSDAPSEQIGLMMGGRPLAELSQP